VPSTFERRLKAELFSRAYDVSLHISDDYRPSLILNGSGFALTVIRFYFAFLSIVRPPSYIFTFLSTAVHIFLGALYEFGRLIDCLIEKALN